MRRFFVVAAVFAIVAGCGNAVDYGIQSAVRERLKDPDSAKFEETRKYENFACVSYNAKNGYGGYAGVSWALLKNTGSRWQVLDMDQDSCYSHELQRLAHIDKASADAEAKMIASENAATAAVLGEFKRRKLIDASVDNLYAIPSTACQHFAFVLLTISRQESAASDQGEKAGRKKQYDSEVGKLDTMRCV